MILPFTVKRYMTNLKAFPDQFRLKEWVFYSQHTIYISHLPICVFKKCVSVFCKPDMYVWSILCIKCSLHSTLAGLTTTAANPGSSCMSNVVDDERFA